LGHRPVCSARAQHRGAGERSTEGEESALLVTNDDRS
jgi:hypothetical protein